MEINFDNESIKSKQANLCFDGDFLLNLCKYEDFLNSDKFESDEKFKIDNYRELQRLTQSKQRKHHIYKGNNLINHFNEYARTDKPKGDRKKLDVLGKRFFERTRGSSVVKNYPNRKKYSSINKYEPTFSALFYYEDESWENIWMKSVSDYQKAEKFSFNSIFEDKVSRFRALLKNFRSKGVKINSLSEFFYPFTNSSKFYYIFDPFLFSAACNIKEKDGMLNRRYQNGMFGYSRKKFQTEYDDFNFFYTEEFIDDKLPLNDERNFDLCLEKLYVYLEWIYKSHVDKEGNIIRELPYVYFCSKLKFGRNLYSSLEAIMLSKRFIKKISQTESFPLSNEEFFDREGNVIEQKKIIFKKKYIKFLKDLILENKLRLIPFENYDTGRFDKYGDEIKFYDYFDDYIHGNIILTDYGYLTWNNRQNALLNVKKFGESVKTQFETIFNYDDMKSIFELINRESNKAFKKINKLGNFYSLDELMK